jgi:hypothetical protein
MKPFMEGVVVGLGLIALGVGLTRFLAWAVLGV